MTLPPALKRKCEHGFACNFEAAQLEMAFKLNKSYYNAGERFPVMHTAADLLDIRGTQHPDKEAFIIREMGTPRQAITFGELKIKTEQMAAGMIKRGLSKGDCVGLLCPTSLECVICEYALARTGAILMRFHVSIRTGEDIKYMLRKSNCRWLIAHPGASDENYDILRTIIPSLASHDCSQKLEADDLPDLETIFMISTSSYPGTISWNEVFREIQDGDVDLVRKRQATISLDDIQGCNATSGSTGFPKLVMKRHSYGMKCLQSLFLRAGVDDSDRYVLDRPMAYSGGSSGMVFSIGLSMVYVVADVMQQIGREYYFQVAEDENCTVLLSFPYLLRDLINAVDIGKLDANRIKLCFTGGELVEKPLMEEVLKRISRTILGYGSTEVGDPVGCELSDSLDKKCTYSGRAYFGELKIVNEEGLIVSVNIPGELCVRHQYIFLGYWGDQERTKQRKDQLGWYRTGDMATMNEDGFVTVLGRQQDVISRATIKIYPRSIEKEILRHPLVANAAAVGVPHEIMFEEICLCVVPKPDVNLKIDDIRGYCEERFLVGNIGEGLRPDHILLFEAFPTGSTDKVDRKKIRETAIARMTKQTNV